VSRLIAREGGTAIGPGTRVTLHFSLHLETGEEVDTTRRGKPATFTVGDGSLPEGFERALFGLKAGDDEQIAIAPSEGFGLRNSENVRTLSRANFPNASDLVPGMMIAFAAAGGGSRDGSPGELPGVVKSVAEDSVEVDFNHPLAGRDLMFDVTILKVDAL